MFLKSTAYKNSRYWSLVQSFRDKKTGVTKHRRLRYLGKTKMAYQIIRNDEDLKYNQKIVNKILERLAVEEAYKKIPSNVKTSLRYIGGKGRKTNTYIELMPNHKRFVSLFSGGCSIELAKKPSKIEILNDTNDELINLLEQIRDNPDELIKRLLEMAISENIFNRMKDGEFMGSNIERAVRYFYISRLGFNGAGGKYEPGLSITDKNQVKEYSNAVKNIEYMGKRMRNYLILSRDFEEIINRYDGKDTFFYADPPYLKRESLYKGGFEWEDHEKLNLLAKRIKGKIMISYDNKYDEIDELYKEDFIKVEYPSKVYMNRKIEGDKCEDVNELIYMNYKLT